MAEASLTQFDAVLKTCYGPDFIAEQLNNKNAILERFDKNTSEYEYDGKNFTFPAHYGRNEGIGSRASGSALPTAGSQSYKDIVIPRKESYGVIKINRDVIKASNKNSGAFAKVLSTEMKGLITDLKNNQNRQLFNDGLGTLATCDGAGTSSTSINVDSTRRLRVGQAIDICAVTGGTEGYGQLNTTVSSITSATRFVCADAVGTYGSLSSDYAVYPYNGHASDNSLGYEPYGLDTIVAETDTITSGFGGLDVSTYPWWESMLTDQSGALTLLALQKMVDDIEAAGNGSPSVIVTTAGCVRAYMSYMDSMRMFTNAMTLDGGIKASSFTANGKTLPIIADKYCWEGDMWFLDESDMVHLVLTDWEWADDDGKIFKWVSNYDQITAYMAKYDNVACYSRNSHGKLYNVTEA
jgi:hypothetical protein